MNSMVKKIAMGLASLSLLAGISSAVLAADAPVIAEKKPHNLVVQVSSDDEKMYNVALNNAAQVQKEVGIDNINIEVVAFGPGLKIFVAGTPVAQRIKDLSLQNIVFTACGNTMKNMEKGQLGWTAGKPVEITEGVRIVPAGLVHIMTLQEKGWSYTRP